MTLHLFHRSFFFTVHSASPDTPLMDGGMGGWMGGSGDGRAWRVQRQVEGGGWHRMAWAGAGRQGTRAK